MHTSHPQLPLKVLCYQRQQRRNAAKKRLVDCYVRLGIPEFWLSRTLTSILSADRNIRGQVLAALREIYDGRWERNVGTDGGKTLLWTGRIVVIGAVTTEWDNHHAVVAAMGDRFACLRLDSSSDDARLSSGMQAILNTGSETQMRAELAEAVAEVIAVMATDDEPVTDKECELILKAANVVTRARTAVEFDYRGDVMMAHAEEMPTRFAKQLTQMVRGGVAVGMTRKRAMQLAMRCARDSIPPLRLEIMLDIARNPRSSNGDVYRRIGKPRTTVSREMDALNMLGILKYEEETKETGMGEEKITWFYSLDDGFDRDTLLTLVNEKPKKLNGKVF